MRSILVAFIFAISVVYSAKADDAIEVQLLSSRGEHYRAMLAYEKLPKRKRNVQAVIAEARSAWALNLYPEAIASFDKALEDPLLQPLDRARVLFSRAVIEFQEKRLQNASLYAERARKLVADGGAFRAKIWLLSGTVFYELEQYGKAAESLQHALEESAVEDEGEIHYLLGQTLLQLNKEDEAEEQLKSIAVTHERIPLALRTLAQIALNRQEPEKAKAWLEKGMKDYPDQFLDSWVAYARVEAALLSSDIQSCRSIRAEANAKYPPSDFWISLLNSSAELGEWKATQGGTPL